MKLSNGRNEETFFSRAFEMLRLCFLALATSCLSCSTSDFSCASSASSFCCSATNALISLSISKESQVITTLTKDINALILIIKNSPRKKCPVKTPCLRIYIKMKKKKDILKF